MTIARTLNRLIQSHPASISIKTDFNNEKKFALTEKLTSSKRQLWFKNTKTERKRRLLDQKAQKPYSLWAQSGMKLSKKNFVIKKTKNLPSSVICFHCGWCFHCEDRTPAPKLRHFKNIFYVKYIVSKSLNFKFQRKLLSKAHCWKYLKIKSCIS